MGVVKLFGRREAVVVRETHRGLWYEDGVLKRVLGPGRYELPAGPEFDLFGRRRHVRVEVVLVDVRERELTIKGQEILTADKVALRVSVIVQFRVTDPTAAVQVVDQYEERLYSDVQLAARRSLASMALESILTNRTQLSEDILREVTATAAGYGVAILRADVKDLIFPGNLQEIMNRVLAAERNSQARLVEARTEAEVRRIDAATKADARRAEAEAEAVATRLAGAADADRRRAVAEADVAALRSREQAAAAYADHPALMRLAELEAMRELARSARARLYIRFDRPTPAPAGD